MKSLQDRIDALEKIPLSKDFDLEGYWKFLIKTHASVPFKEGEITFNKAEQIFIEQYGIDKTEFFARLKKSVMRNSFK